MMMSPNKDETAVHGCHCPGDMAVRMSKVLAITVELAELCCLTIAFSWSNKKSDSGDALIVFICSFPHSPLQHFLGLLSSLSPPPPTTPSLRKFYLENLSAFR